MYKSIFLLPSSRNVLFVKRIESLIPYCKHEILVVKLGNPFSQKVSFLVVKTVKRKRGIRQARKLISFIKFYQTLEGSTDSFSKNLAKLLSGLHPDLPALHESSRPNVML